MGNKYVVYGWTFGDQWGTGKKDWYAPTLYRGESLVKALWIAFTSRRHHGCVKMEMR